MGFAHCSFRGLCLSSSRRASERSVMVATIVLLGLAALVWAVLHRKLKSIWVNGPMIMVVIGAVIGLFVGDGPVKFLDSHLALNFAELSVALL